MENLSSSSVALVALWCADKRLCSALALVRVGRALLSSFLRTHCGVQFCDRSQCCSFVCD